MAGRRRFWPGFALGLGLFLAPLPAPTAGPPTLPAAKADSASAFRPSIPAGTQAAQDSLGKHSPEAKPDTLARPKSRADSVIVVKHGFNHREQIITGSVVMTCLALILVAMNNYNPR